MQQIDLIARALIAATGHQDWTLVGTDAVMLEGTGDVTQLSDVEGFAVAYAALTLPTARTAGIAAVNAWAGRARLAYVTDAPGQAMVYLAKQAEAARYLADPEPNLGTYPMLSAEVGITAPSAYELAQLWANMAAIWSSAAAQIEAARLTAIAAISTANSAAEVDAAIAALPVIGGAA